MAGRIPQDFINDLIDRSDIVEVIGSRIQLKKAGREYKACCPFHGEKTPSFTVSPDKGFYHCFGCGAHGTAIGFLWNMTASSSSRQSKSWPAINGVEVPRDAGDGTRFHPPHHCMKCSTRPAAVPGAVARNIRPRCNT